MKARFSLEIIQKYIPQTEIQKEEDIIPSQTDMYLKELAKSYTKQHKKPFTDDPDEQILNRKKIIALWMM